MEDKHAKQHELKPHSRVDAIQIHYKGFSFLLLL
jgi:hypothetical protein